METSAQQRPAASAFLATVEILSVFTPEELDQLAEAIEPRAYAFGDTICSAGEAADGLFVIKSGSVRVFGEEHGKETSMGVRKAGEVFAEVAMLRPYRHELSARAALKTELWFIARSAIEPVVARNGAALDFINNYVAISSAGGLVARLFDLRGKVSKPELEEFVRSVGVKRVGAGKEILKQEARDDRRLYVVRQGQVRVVHHDGGDEYVLATLGPGEIFGEKACLMRQEQPASVVAAGEAVLLVVPEKSAHFILERNVKFREVIEERVRFFERELHRQKRLAERRKRPVILDLASQPKAGEKIIKRFALVEQAEEINCGAACLAMLCRHYGINMTLGKLRELANVTTQGATLDSLARAGEALGFGARGLPSQLLKRRPDVVAAEYRVLVAYDLVGQAKLAQLPSISLTGRGGTSSFALGSLLKSFTFGLLPSINFPIFDPSVKARLKTSEARTEVAEGEYRRVVMAAFEEVENALVNLDAHRRQRIELAQQAEWLGVVAAQVEAQMKEGMVSQLDLFESQRTLLASQLALLANHQQILSDTVLLYKALGGGWPAVEVRNAARD